MTVLVLRSDARRIPLRDDSVDLIVTSPPYFELRSYGAGKGEIGAEGHWREWLAALVGVTAEMVRVLKPEGSIFVDLGDKYASSGGHADDGEASTLDGRLHVRAPNSAGTSSRRGWAGIPAKSLMLLPERYRIACVDQLGLIARAVICWEKVNGLPESVRDRVRRSHEDWVHLTKQGRYFSALDELREPHAPDSLRASKHAPGRPFAGARNDSLPHNPAPYDGPNPLGKLPGSVWSIPSEPLHLPAWLDTRHYAAFPSEWPRRLILGWSPSGICLECGQGRFPVVDRKPMVWRESPTVAGRTAPGASRRPASGTMLEPAEATILGYACVCTPHTDHPDRRQPSLTPDGHTGTGYMRDGDAVQAAREAAGMRRTHMDGWPERQPVREYHLDRWTPPPTRPAVVLDPFSGTGTTSHVAHALGRIGVSLDLSAAYCRLAADRTLAATRVAKVHERTNRERQLGLFSGLQLQAEVAPG